MKMKGIGIGVLIALVLSGVWAVSSRNAAEQEEQVSVAFNIPLSGELAVYGEAIRDGSQYALTNMEEAVRSKYALDFEDNQGDIGETVTVLHKQLMDSPDVYVSALKPQTQAITNQVSEKKLPHFTWILDIGINETSDNNIRNWVNFGLEAEVFLEYAERMEIEKVAIVYVDLPSAEKEYNQFVIPGLREQGVTDFYVEPFALDKTTFRDTALKIKQYEPDLIIVNGFIPQMTNIMQDLRNLDVDLEGKTLASLDMLDAALTLPADLTEGIVVAAPEFLVTKNESYLAWEEGFVQQFGYEPMYHHAYAYDNMFVLEEAVKTGVPLKEALRGVVTHGVTGPISFDEDGSLVTSMIPAVYRGGELVAS